MKKLTIAIIAVLSLSACDKMPWNHGPKATFVKMCKDDPNAKAQDFDCGCQADVLNAVLKPEEMTKLIDFINIEKADKAKAAETAKDPSYAPIFQKIAGVGYAIHDKCSKPGSVPTPAPQASAPVQTAPAQAPAAQAATPAPTKTHAKK